MGGWFELTGKHFNWSKSKKPFIRLFETPTLEGVETITNQAIQQGLFLLRTENLRSEFYSSFVVTVGNRASIKFFGDGLAPVQPTKRSNPSKEKSLNAKNKN